MHLIHVLWYLDKYLLGSGYADAVFVVDDTPAMAAKIAMSDVRTKVAFLAVSAIKQKDLGNAVGGALQHAIIMRYMLEADQTEQGATAATWDTQEEWLQRGIPLWVLDSNRGYEGHQQVPAAEAVKEDVVTEAPADDTEPVAPAPTLPMQAKVRKTANIIPTQGPPRVARSRQKEKRRNRTSPRNQTTTMPTRRRKKRIQSKYWRPSRCASGHPPLTLMQAPNLVRNSRRRKRRLLPVLVQSSSRPRVLVPSRLVVPLPLQMGQVRSQEAWVPGWLRLLDRRRNKSPLTPVFRLFLQSCVREASRTRLRRECNYMPLRACTFLPSFNLSVCTLCTSCAVFVAFCT